MHDNDTVPYAAGNAWWPEYAPDEILPRLWQGGTEDDDVIGQPTPRGHYRAGYPFDLVVTLYADAQPAPWEVEELRYGFPDSALTPTGIRQAVALSGYAYDRWQAGGRILIRCQAGVNRSGLVMALTLMRAGYPAGEAIALIRARRSPAVLSNRHFTKWLIEEAAALLDAQQHNQATRQATPTRTTRTTGTASVAGRTSSTDPGVATATAA